MNAFDVASVLIAVAAISGYVNHRFLKLPAASGTLAIALVSSMAVVVASRIDPALRLEQLATTFLSRIDFNETLMHGMLSLLLFAGALHVDLDGLLENKWTIIGLATVGVLLSTTVIGLLAWWTFALLAMPVPLLVCLAFGALISPTDPIVVIGLLKELRAPRSLEAQIAGESLFNDGIGVVVFLAIVSLAGLSSSEATAPQLDAVSLAAFFAREVAGGIALGLVFGYVSYRALKSLDDHALELLITLAVAMFTYSLSFWIDVSGPIAVVVAGLLIGNPGRKFAMSTRTREHVDAFWSMIDNVLNALLFLLIGLQVFAVSEELGVIAAGLLAIPLALLGRLVGVGVPIAVARVRSHFVRGLVPVLTWSGLRGGISVAMVLSLPPFPARDLLLMSTYSVVVFSILVQGLTVRRLLVHFALGDAR